MPLRRGRRRRARLRRALCEPIEAVIGRDDEVLVAVDAVTVILRLVARDEDARAGTRVTFGQRSVIRLPASRRSYSTMLTRAGLRR